MKKLEKIPKQNPFRTPDNYFKNVNERILRQISAEKGWRAKSTIRLWPLTAIAASVLLVISITLAIKFSHTPARDNFALNGFESVQTIDYLLYGIDLTALEENFAELLQESKLTDVAGEEIIDYLVNENISILEITEHL